MFGFCIGSYFENNIFMRYELMKSDRGLNIFRNYYRSLFTCNEYDMVIKKRAII